MTEAEVINEMMMLNEQLAGDIRELTYKIADLTETVEILTRIVATEKAND